METKKSYGMNIGLSSILVIFVILCLVCFAGLSVTSANADLRLSQKLAERTTAYYKAGNLANQHMLELSNAFSKIYAASENQKEYEEKIKESFSDSLTFSYPINENQILKVSVSPLYPESAEGNFLMITCYKTETLITPELNQSLPVFLGN